MDTGQGWLQVRSGVRRDKPLRTAIMPRTVTEAVDQSQCRPVANGRCIFGPATPRRPFKSRRRAKWRVSSTAANSIDAVESDRSLNRRSSYSDTEYTCYEQECDSKFKKCPRRLKRSLFRLPANQEACANSVRTRSQ